MQTAIYDSKVVIFKTGNIPSTWSWLNAVVRFECENSAIDVIINFLWKIFHKPSVLVVLTTANFGGFSNFCRYYTWSQTGKSTGPLWNPCTCQRENYKNILLDHLRYQLAPRQLPQSSYRIAKGLSWKNKLQTWSNRILNGGANQVVTPPKLSTGLDKTSVTRSVIMITSLYIYMDRHMWSY